MHRIQIQLTSAQERRLRDLAKLRGASISALVREGVDRLLDPQVNRETDRWERALAAVGMFSDTATDVSQNHDRYLAESVAQHKIDKHT